jgi:single-strand DNA-binding protein
MNKVILIGNLARDPELTTTNSGVSVCRFSIAVQRRFATGENGPQVDFFNIVVWRTQGENCHKFLKKGSKCCVVGRLQNSSYEAQDGTKRYSTDIVAEEVEFLGTKPSDGENVKNEDAPVSAGTSDLQPIDDDSLPF